MFKTCTLVGKQCSGMTDLYGAMKFDSKWYPLIESGRKKCTTRLEQKASQGDIIRIGDLAILVTSIERIPFRIACEERKDYWYRDGFDSVGEYRDELVRYYPVLENDMDRSVFVHRFRLIPDIENKADRWSDLPVDVKELVLTSMVHDYYSLRQKDGGL